MSERYSFQPLRADGGGATMSIAIQNGILIVGGDIEGMFRSADNGDHWTCVNNGNTAQYLNECACVVWSQTESNTVYAGVGNAGTSGGFLASTDGGFTWALRSTAVQFSGNTAKSPLPTSWPRSIGNLIAQDGTYVYAATYNSGVFMSSADGSNHWGTNWTNIGLAGGSYYCRSIAVDTLSNPGHTIIYVATYDWSTASPGTYGHIWQYDSSQPSPSFVQLTQSPPLVEELKIVGGYLYAVCGCGGSYTVGTSGNPVNPGNPGGVYRVSLSGLTPTTSWTSLNDTTYILPSTSSTTPPYWQSMDGYVDSSGNHNIIVGCFNPIQPTGLPGYRALVQLTITNPTSDTNFSVSYSDLSATITAGTGSAPSQGSTNVLSPLVPPDNRVFWGFTNHNWRGILGSKQTTVGGILIDPNNTQHIYVTGVMGVYRTLNGGANWQIAVNGMQLYNARSLRTDPNNPLHLAHCADDYGVVTISDGIGYDINSTVNNTPKPNQEGYCLAYDPVGNSAGSTLYLSLGAKYANNSGDVFHLPAGSTTWVDDQLNLAGNTQPLALDAFNRNVAGGWGMSATVVVATLSALPSYSYSSGVITATSVGGPLVIDGYTLATANLVLIKNETGPNAPYNGIYTVTQAGNSTTAFKLTRASSFNVASEVPAAMISVTSGTVNSGEIFVCTTPGPASGITIGTTPITFVQETNNLPINGNWVVQQQSASAFSVGGGVYDSNSQSITPGTGNIQLPTTTGFKIYVVTLPALTAVSSSGQVNVSWSAPAAGQLHYATIVLCYTTNNPNNIDTYYSLRLSQAPAPTPGTQGAVTITIVAYYVQNVSGTYSQTNYQLGAAPLNPGASGLIFLNEVQAATTAPLPNYIYNNGSSGVGATITAVSSIGQLTVDGYETLVGDRILVQSETGSNQAYNGIYVITDNGASGNAFVLTRSTDFDTPTQVSGTYTSVVNGVTNEFASFSCSTTGSMTFGTTAISWASMQQQYYVPGQTVTMQYVLQQITEKGGGLANEIYFSAWTGGAGNQPANWLLNKTDSTYLGPGGLSGAVGLGAEVQSGYTGGAQIQFSNLDISTPATPSQGPNGEVAIGLHVGRDGSNNRYVLAAVQSSGIWRKLAQGNWSLVSTTDNTLADAQAATAAALPANTYNNGSNGVGASLTATTNGALIVDGYTVQTNDRILVKNEGATSNNGMYVVMNTGSASSAYVLTRSMDFNAPSQIPNAFVYVINGTINGNLSFICTSNDVITMGSTSITWSYAPMCATQPTQSAWFATALGSAHVYLFDRGSGIYCSTNYGVAGSWSLVWSITASDGTHGYIAMNPNYQSGDEVWVSTNSGLYKLSNAANGSVGNGVTLTQISAVTSPGPITFAPDGSIFCINLAYTDTSQVFHPTQLLRSDNGVTWLSVGDIGLERITNPVSISIATNGRIYIGTNGNAAIVGYSIGQSQTT